MLHILGNGIESFMPYILLLATFVILLIIEFLALLISLRVMDAKNTDSGTVFATTFLSVIIYLVLIALLGLIGFVLAVIIILVLLKERHTKDYLKAFAALVLWVVFAIIIIIIVGIALGASLITIQTFLRI